MTRAWFLGLIGLGAAGQTATIPPVTRQSPRYPGTRFTARGECVATSDGATRGCAVESGSTREPPKNGECPVCGTMADPYKGQPVSYVINCTTGFSPTCTFEPIYIASDPRLTRCLHCNAAFWQDCEEAK